MAESVEHGRRELEVQNEQLRQSERAKSELITIVSHELRTPLSSILGYTRLLLKRNAEQDSKTVQQYVEIIHDQGERLAGLIEGFLAAEDRNGGGMELEYEAGRRRRARPPRGRPDRRRLARPRAQRRGRRGPPRRPRRRRAAGAGGDQPARRTRSSTRRPAGGSGCASTARGGSIVSSVQDEGLGIPAEHQSRVFSKFFRGEARASGIPGVGLGLAVSREIVEAHGGRIGFTSVESTGLDVLVRAARIGSREGRASLRRGIRAHEVAGRVSTCYQCPRSSGGQC